MRLPNPNITLIHFGTCTLDEIGNIGNVFPNTNHLVFDADCTLTSFAVIVPSSIKNITFHQNHGIDFSQCKFQATPHFLFGYVSNFKSIDTILPLVAGTHLATTFRISLRDIVAIHSNVIVQAKYDDTIVYVIQNHKGTGRFEGRVIKNHWKSKTFRALWANPSFVHRKWRRNKTYTEQSSIIAFLSVNHVHKLGSQTAIKKLPKDLLRVLASFVI